MRLCVLGWFGHRNAGDDRIAEVLVDGLPGHHLTYLPAEPLPSEVINHFDGVVLCAGTWHERSALARDFERWSRDVHVPIAALGLGIESVTPAMQSSARALVERTVFLWVRDAHSRQLLGDDPKVEVGPDLTFFDPIPTRHAHGHGIALNLRPWSRATWQPEAWVDAARDAAIDAAGFDGAPDLAPWAFDPGDRVMLECCGFAPTKQFSFDPALGAELVVAMRLHALIFATQMGVPAIGLAYEPKVERFLASIGAEARCLDLRAPQRLPEIAAATRAQSAEIAEAAVTWTQTFRDRATVLFESARSALEDAHGRRRSRPPLDARILTRLGRWLLARGHRRGRGAR